MLTWRFLLYSYILFSPRVDRCHSCFHSKLFPNIDSPPTSPSALLLHTLYIDFGISHCIPAKIGEDNTEHWEIMTASHHRYTTTQKSKCTAYSVSSNVISQHLGFSAENAGPQTGYACVSGNARTAPGAARVCKMSDLGRSVYGA